MLGHCYTPTKYASSSSGVVPSAWSPRFVPVSASRKVTNALLGTFHASVAEGMGTSTADVAVVARREAVCAGIFTASCSFPGVRNNENIDLVASYVGALAVSSLSPRSDTSELSEVVLVPRRLKSVRSMNMVVTTIALVVKMRWFVGDSIMREDKNLREQPLHPQRAALYIKRRLERRLRTKQPWSVGT